MSVRARVSGATAEQVAPLIGSADARLVDGTIVSNGPDTMIVEVPTVMLASVGSSVETLHQRVALPHAAVYELETKRLDRMRTGAVVGGAAGRMRGGRHLVFPAETPMTNLLLTMLDKVGVEAEKLGDSTGKLQIEPLSGV